MSESIHGHAVMQMMLEEGKSYTKESLCEAIRQQFGENARFHTCAADGLDAEALVDFLATRGKFLEAEDGFTTAPEHICAHDENH